VTEEEPEFDDLIAPYMKVALETTFECAQGSCFALAVLIKHLHDRHLLDLAGLREEFLHVAAAIQDEHAGFASREGARTCDELLLPPDGSRPPWFRGVIDGGKR